MRRRRPIPSGQKYGNLQVLREVDNARGDGRRYVLVKCECGSTKVVRYDSVKSGRVKSCGCLVSKSAVRTNSVTLKPVKSKERNDITSYIGKKFAKLTVVQKHIHPTQKCSWVKVVCDCGNKLCVNLNRLKSGRVKSCGCLSRENAVEYISEVDGEKLSVYSTPDGYFRLASVNHADRELLHRYETRKVLDVLGETPEDFIVHHIDCNTKNNKLSNLSIFCENGPHHKHHKLLGKAMYQFIENNNLLDSFYKQFPDLKLISIEEMLNEERT